MPSNMNLLFIPFLLIFMISCNLSKFADKELATSEWDTLAEVAVHMKGIASVVFVDCS